MLHIRKAKLFRRPNILITTIYLICGFSFFGHPVWLKQPFIGLVYPFWKEVSQNAPHQKGKTFQETQYFDKVYTYHFFPPKYVDFHFLDGHPVWLKKLFIGLFYPFLKKGSQNAPYNKGKIFQETQYFDHYHLSHFFHQNMWIFIFWTTCMVKIPFYWLGLSIFEKRPPKCSTSERQNFSGNPIF